jgi:hypothetical protein
MRFGFINNFAAQIAAPLTDTATEVELSTGADVIATLLESADVVALTLFTTDSQGNETQNEVVYAAAATPPMVTIERAKEDTTPAAFTAGDGVEARLTAAQLNNVLQGVAGFVPLGYSGAVALGSAYEYEDQSFLAAQALAMGALALGSGTYATADSAVAIGSKMFAALSWDSEPVSVEAAQANGVGSVAIGPGAEASASLSVAVGDGSRAYGVRSLALADATASGSSSCAIGLNSEAQGEQSLALNGGYASGLRAFAVGSDANAGGEDTLAFYGSSYSDRAIVLGVQASVNAPEGIAIGVGASSNAPESISVGKGASANGEGVTVVGRNAEASSPKSSAFGDGASAQPPGVTSLGAGAEGWSPEVVSLGMEARALAPYSVAIGSAAEANLPGGLAVNAVSYLPAAYRQAGEFAGPPPTATRQAAMQVIIGTVALDLTDGAAVATVELPSDAILLPDAFDVVVVESDTPGGAPEIQIGPDDATPAAYLASTLVTKTAVGSRETHTPLVTDGITALRVAVVTAGTGTAYKIKVVVRGYVMEV